MATFVLVHGAWGGAHGFRKLRPLLQSTGHAVFTPSLTGIGERSHLASAQVTLSTHVADVVNAIVYEDLDDLVLLGFSYGGMVVTGALAHVADRVRHLVYLDAFVPDDGQSVFAIVGAPGPGPLTPGAVWQLPPMPRAFDDPAEAEWTNARRSPQPVGTFAEPVRLDRPLEAFPFTRTYVKATADPDEQPGSAFWRAAERAKASSAWTYHQVATNHMIPSNRPDDLARILLALA